MTTREGAHRPLDPAVPLEVAAGPATLVVVNGTVRWISVRGMETVRGIYGAVRDPSWGTIEPRFTAYEGAIGRDSFEVRFRAECVRDADGVDFAWTGTVAGTADGRIRFVFDGTARSAFLAARIGLCVLHPPRLAGQPVEVETLFGRLRGRFPDLVTGYMPFSNIVRMRHDTVRVHETQIDFSGEPFQTEDQRAFTDASFKTFCRPLELPQPFKVDAGTTIRQVVSVAFPRVGTQRAPARTSDEGRPLAVRLGSATRRTFPVVGAARPPAEVDADRVSEAVRSLGLAHLRVTIDARQDGVARAIESAAASARAISAALEVVLLAEPESPRLGVAVDALARAGIPIARLLPIDPARHTTSPALATRLRRAVRGAGLAVPLVGGTRGYLYQLVSQGVPVDLVDLVGYPTNPQVHASDAASVVESIASLDATVRTAAALAGGKPVVVGPVSLKPLFNPDLLGPELPPPPGGLPARYDSRQPTAFAAAWTLGCAAAFARAGAVALTLHETAGWAGLVATTTPGLPAMPAAPGVVLPVGVVVAALAGLGRFDLVETEAPEPLHAVAVRTGPGAIRVLVANLGSVPQRARILAANRPLVVASVARLEVDAADGAAWHEEPPGPNIELRPNEVVRVDAGRDARPA